MQRVCVCVFSAVKGSALFYLNRLVIAQIVLEHLKDFCCENLGLKDPIC